MSGRVEGNQGPGNIFKKLFSGAKENAPTSPAESQPKVAGDTMAFASVSKRLAQAADVAPLGPKQLVTSSRDLHEAIAKNIAQEFPGLRLNPAQRAAMIDHVAKGLEERGFGQERFEELKATITRKVR